VSTRVKLAIGILLLIVLISIGILIVSMFRKPVAIEQEIHESGILVEAGNVQLLDSFTQPIPIPERVATVRLDGLLVLQTGTGYATLTIDGITSTMVVSDYIGDYIITSITTQGVELRSGQERIMITLANNRLDITRKE